MTHDAIINVLLTQVAAMPPREDANPVVFPCISDSAIRSAEASLGLALPNILKRVYREVGNGGSGLGPGYGILGVPGGYDNDDGWNIVKSSLEMASAFEWWDQYVVICDWGCAEVSCIDCTESDFPIFRFNGNLIDDLDDPSATPEHAWFCEADTIEEWLLTPNYGH